MGRLVKSLKGSERQRLFYRVEYAGAIYVEIRQPMVVLDVAELPLVVKQKEVDWVAALGGESAYLLHQHGKEVGLSGACRAGDYDLCIGDGPAVDVERCFHLGIAIIANQQVERRYILCKRGTPSLREKKILKIVVGKKQVAAATHLGADDAREHAVVRKIKRRVMIAHLDKCRIERRELLMREEARHEAVALLKLYCVNGRFVAFARRRKSREQADAHQLVVRDGIAALAAGCA